MVDHQIVCRAIYLVNMSCALPEYLVSACPMGGGFPASLKIVTR